MSSSAIFRRRKKEIRALTVLVLWLVKFGHRSIDAVFQNRSQCVNASVQNRVESFALLLRKTAQYKTLCVANRVFGCDPNSQSNKFICFQSRDYRLQPVLN